jgi:NAD+ synthase
MDNFGKDSKCVIGISGGKDSSVVAALCVEAVGRDRVFGVLMPNGRQPDIDYSYKLVENLGIEYYVADIEDACSEIEYAVSFTMKKPLSVQAKINMPSRMRMLTLYAVAQTLGNAYVVNTGNLSERFVGYFTWHGDGAGDFAPIANFTSDEVIAIGDVLNLPEYLVHKTPADGLSGKTDEDRLGFSYCTLNEYIRLGTITDEIVKNKIDKLHSQNAFKQLPLDSYTF